LKGRVEAELIALRAALARTSALTELVRVGLLVEHRGGELVNAVNEILAGCEPPNSGASSRRRSRRSIRSLLGRPATPIADRGRDAPKCTHTHVLTTNPR